MRSTLLWLICGLLVAACAVLVLGGLFLSVIPYAWGPVAGVSLTLLLILPLTLLVPARFARAEPKKKTSEGQLAVERLAAAAGASTANPAARPRALRSLGIAAVFWNGTLLAIASLVGSPGELFGADSMRLPERLLGADSPLVLPIKRVLGTDERRIRSTVRRTRQAEIALRTGQPREHVDQLPDCYTQARAGKEALKLVRELTDRPQRLAFLKALASAFSGKEVTLSDEEAEEAKQAKLDGLEFRRRYRLDFLTDEDRQKLLEESGREMLRDAFELPSVRRRLKSLLDPSRPKGALGDPVDMQEIDADHAAESVELTWVDSKTARAVTPDGRARLVRYTLSRAEGDWYVSARELTSPEDLEKERAQERAKSLDKQVEDLERERDKALEEEERAKEPESDGEKEPEQEPEGDGEKEPEQEPESDGEKELQRLKDLDAQQEKEHRQRLEDLDTKEEREGGEAIEKEPSRPSK